MSPRRATAMLALLAVAAGMLGCGRAATAPPAAPRVFTVAPTSPAPSTGPQADAQPSSRAVRRLTARFIGAYLRWEVNQASPADVRTLLSSSSTTVAAVNFSAPPRRPNAGQIPPQARVVSITVPVSRESESLGAVAVIVRLSRRGRREQMSLVVGVEDGRTSVTDLSPPHGV